MIDKWDYRFFRLAEEVATWSHDPRMKVGSVIIKDKKVISTGYNGVPAGLSDWPELYQNRKYKLAHVIHAEHNAVLNATTDVRGGTIYSTFSPCQSCCLVIIQSQLARVVTPEPIEGTPWEESQYTAIALMESVGILVEAI